MTDNDTVSFEASAVCVTEHKGKTCIENGDDESDDSDFYDGDILKSYLKMLHDSLIKSVIIAPVDVVDDVVDDVYILD